MRNEAKPKDLITYKEGLIDFANSSKTFPSENLEMLIQLLRLESYIESQPSTEIREKGKNPSIHTAIEKRAEFRRRVVVPMCGRKLNTDENESFCLAMRALKCKFIENYPKC